MIPYPGCESAIVCPRCGICRHSAQFPYIGETRSKDCLFCQPKPVVKNEPRIVRVYHPKVRKERDIRFGFTTRVSGSQIKFAVYTEGHYRETVVCQLCDQQPERKRMIEKYQAEHGCCSAQQEQADE